MGGGGNLSPFKIDNKSTHIEINYSGDVTISNILSISADLFNNEEFRTKPTLWRLHDLDKLLSLDASEDIVEQILRFFPQRITKHKAAIVVGDSHALSVITDILAENIKDIPLEIKSFEQYDDALAWISSTTIQLFIYK